MLAVALLAAAGPAACGEWSGEIALETRAFLHAPLDPTQHDGNASLYLEPDYYHDWQEGEQRFSLTLFARLDANDSERTHADLRDAYWRKSFSRAELFVGLRKVFWGVTESVHLVDIINQNDLVENVDTEDKLGQPMVDFSLLRDWGTLDLFLMPYFRERTFPGREGRLRVPLPVDTDNVLYESSDRKRHLDLALRWSHFVGDWDLGLAHFSGTGRDPRLLPGVNAGGEPVLVPRYELIDQTSLDIQATKGDWLWKLEAIVRRDDLERFAALAGGFEYTLVGLAGSAIDLGIVAEYLYDERGEGAAAFQNELALGARLAFNDVQSTELLLITGLDLDNRSLFGSLEGSRRIGQSWKLSLEARLFSNVSPRDPLFFLREDDYLELVIARFF